MGKIFANYMSDKGLIPKIYEKQSVVKETNNNIFKWAKDFYRHFPKEDVQITNRYMKGCSSLLIIVEIHIKTTLSSTCSSGYCKRRRKDKCWRRCVEIGTLVHCWWELTM